MTKGDDKTRGDDEFRRRLKDLGYLENPLDKFFIGASHGRTGVLLANLKIALKVGVLGGVFLGIATTIGLSLLAPEVVYSLPVAAKLALCFSVVFTVLFAALELAICLVVTFLGRTFRRLFTRTEMIALYSGAFAGLAVLAYGTLWWWAGAGGANLLSRRTMVAFAVIAALSVVAGFLTRLGVTSLLALLGGADLAARGKGRATKLYVLILVCGIAIFAGYRLATAKPIPLGPSQYEIQRSNLDVTIIAIDGAALEVFDMLSESDSLPNIASLAERGFVAALSPPDIHINPAVWTTVATGVTPAKHGVTTYSAQEIPGLGLYIKDKVGSGLYDALLAALPAVGLSRRAPLERRGVSFPALWDVLAQKGVPSGVVNWWGTWPATDFHGFMVTDRLYPKLQAARVSGDDVLFEDEVYPEALFDELSDYPLASARMSDDPLEAAQDIDRFAVSSILTATGDYSRLGLEAVYLPGLDICENALYSGLETGWSVAEAARISRGVAAYWEYLDGLLEPLLDRAGPSHVVIIVGDPGMMKPPERRFGRRTSKGFVIIAGGPVVPGRFEMGVELVDIAPTVLYLLGFPVSGEMDSRPPQAAIDKDYLSRHPLAHTETFGRVEVKSPGGYSVDAELVDRLKSLGYLQ